MDSNVVNGGLVIQTDSHLLVKDMIGYSGTFMLNRATGERAMLDHHCWFMDVEDHFVYFSAQEQGHALYRLDLNSLKSECLINEPCYGLTRADQMLYYINENNRKLYRCTKEGRHNKKITDFAVDSFLINEGNIYLATQQGIRKCSLNGDECTVISDSIAIGMILLENTLIYANKSRNYTLTMLNATTCEEHSNAEIIPASLNTDGKYLFCTNRRNNNSIYRLDLSHGGSIRIYGDRAEYLHFIDEHLYFLHKCEWFRMSTLGGQAVKVITLL